MGHEANLTPESGNNLMPVQACDWCNKYIRKRETKIQGTAVSTRDWQLT